MGLLTYQEILHLKEQQLPAVSTDHFKLNQLHEDILHQVLKSAISNVTMMYGPPPSSFSFFVMGSSGRREQAVWSDQDHGIVYNIQSEKIKDYFLKLGTEITNGLNIAGYPYCDGNVMASNPLWCKSLKDWQEQLADWTSDATWESLRNLLIFIDSRSIFGEKAYIEQLKDWAYQEIRKVHLLKKLSANTLHHKKGLNVLGQILTETHGPHAGALNIKETAILPFVNAARLIAIKMNMQETSTLLRLELLPDACYKQPFLHILTERLRLANHTNYEDGHFIPLSHLTKSERKGLKDALKKAEAFTHYTTRLIEKDD